MSAEPLANIPSGKAFIVQTLSEWPNNVRTNFPVEGFQILMVLSKEQLARAPPGISTRARMLSVCPRRV